MYDRPARKWVEQFQDQPANRRNLGAGILSNFRERLQLFRGGGSEIRTLSLASIGDHFLDNSPERAYLPNQGGHLPTPAGRKENEVAGIAGLARG